MGRNMLSFLWCYYTCVNINHLNELFHKPCLSLKRKKSSCLHLKPGVSAFTYFTICMYYSSSDTVTKFFLAADTTKIFCCGSKQTEMLFFTFASTPKIVHDCSFIWITDYEPQPHIKIFPLPSTHTPWGVCTSVKVKHDW